jgi:hypothetical protein
VRACNSFDDLVAALQNVVACLHGSADGGKRASVNMAEQACRVARAALAKAGA